MNKKICGTSVNIILCLIYILQIRFPALSIYATKRYKNQKVAAIIYVNKQLSVTTCCRD